jgi:hypothetical protein
MKLAVFFPASLFSAWACSYGLVDCLRRMGHEVTSLPIAATEKTFPVPLDVDGVIVSGPEHIGKHVVAKDVPVIAWLHETVEREDYGKLDVDAIKRTADIVFCPAIQDEKYGFKYLPFGVDTEIFKPAPTDKTIDAGFIGLLYPKRQAFLAELKKHGVNLITGNVQVLELGGVNPRKTAELYAENIRKIKVFVNLPTLSQLAVTKVLEVLACGTHLLTPTVSDMRNFDGLPCDPYEPNAEKLSNRLKLLRMAGSDEILHNHGQTNAEIMHDKHRLELRCEVLVNALKEIGAKDTHEILATA